MTEARETCTLARAISWLTRGVLSRAVVLRGIPGQDCPKAAAPEMPPHPQPTTHHLQPPPPHAHPSHPPIASRADSEVPQSTSHGRPWLAMAGQDWPWLAIPRTRRVGTRWGQPWPVTPGHGQPWPGQGPDNDYGRPWSAFAGHGWLWSVMAGHGWSWGHGYGRSWSPARLIGTPSWRA